MEAGRRSGDARATQAIGVLLPRSTEAPALARAATKELCKRLPLSDSRCQILLVLVSEVVTNAVKYSDGAGETGITFRATEIGGGAVRIEVQDGGTGFQPQPRDPSKADGGWGLHLVDQESRSWGVDASAGTRVWFELGGT
jgi:anti-sigma regulatory factor (Ser/Thr protein kinase)